MLNHARITLPLLLMLFVSSVLQAQYSANGNFWKKHRTEYYASLGATSFLGELGGRNEIGSDFVYDFELNETRWGVNLGVRHFLKKNIAIRGNFMLGYLSGNDNKTEEPFRRKRNLHFRSLVFELTAIAEYNFRLTGIGKRYRKIGVNSRTRSRFSETVYSLFIGVGGLKFNPQGKFENRWYNLRPFGTEGQNFSDGPKRYSLYTVVVPLGFNVRKSISRKINLSLEFCHRITFSDYIDDVSTVYYDNESILNYSGEAAAYLADPSFEFLVREDGEVVYTDNTYAGLQRGDSKDKDSYMTMMLGVNYKLNTYGFKRRRKTVNSRRRKGRGFVF